MESVGEMANFISLWDLVQNVQLTNETDVIHGEYSAKTAYNIQFAGSRSQFDGASI